MSRFERSMTILVTLLSLIFIVTGTVIGAPPSLEGYLKHFTTVIVRQDAPQDPPAGAVNSRLRLKFLWDPEGPLAFSAAYDLAPRVQDALLYTAGNGFEVFGRRSAPYRVVDVNGALYGPEGGAALFQNIDRAVVAVYAGPVDLLIGRQAVAWGSARGINPTDVLSPFLPTELDREERPGVDAVRIRIPAGDLGEFDTGYVAGRDATFEKSAVYARNVARAYGADVTMTAAVFRENLLAGFDAAGPIRGAGGWIEAAYVWPRETREEDSDPAEYFRGSTGLGCWLGGCLHGYLEYHFNGAGTDLPAAFSGITDATAYTEGAVFLMGRHYLIPGISWQATPRIGVGSRMMVNLTDGSFFSAPFAEYNLRENVYLALGAVLGAGAAPDVILTGGIATYLIRSEFGSYPDIYYTSFRVYFL